jgi:aspartate/methionine/tyrosine aminotransferase
MKLLADRLNNLGSENAFKVGEDIARCEQMGMKVIRLNLGEPDFNSPEFINKVAIENINKGNSHYCPPAGIPSFRKAIANHIFKTRGLKVDLNQVVVTTGGKPPIGYTLTTYVNPGDEVIYPSPGFPIYESWVTFIDAKAVPLHLDEARGFSFTAADLEKLITPKTKVIFINSPSNPTGGVLAEDELRKIAEVINRKCSPSVRVYSDEIYEHILFDGEKHHSIATMPGMANKTIIASGHSKSFAMTGWRLGYAVLPTVEEAEVFKNLNINITSCTPPFIQEAGREALENPEADVQINIMCTAFRERRDYVVAALNAIEGVHCAMPKGAFYVFPNIGGVCKNIGAIDAFEKLPKEIAAKSSPSTLFQRFLLYKYGVATMDRRSFGRIGCEGKHFLRISTATHIDILKAGLKQLEKAAKDREGFEAFIKENKYVY